MPINFNAPLIPGGHFHPRSVCELPQFEFMNLNSKKWSVLIPSTEGGNSQLFSGNLAYMIKCEEASAPLSVIPKLYHFEQFFLLAGRNTVQF